MGLEARLDGIVASRATAAHAGLGLTRRAARHLEMQLVGGRSASRCATAPTTRTPPDAPTSSPASRRVPDDPTQWSAYAGGGVSALMERGARGRAVLALVIGARNRRLFVEAGLGGGLRLGSGVRF